VTPRLGALTRREYRSMWAYRGLQAVLLLVLIVPTFALYWPAKGIVWLFEWAEDWRSGLYVRCYNRDLARRDAP
jgi:hypothetical protein